MYGAYIGDYVGSKYEFESFKSKDFPLFSPDYDYTDDTVMTAAVAKAILLSREQRYCERCGQPEGKSLAEYMTETLRDFGRRYPHPMGAYGTRFSQWLQNPPMGPYGSCGNGSAMRVSACATVAVDMGEALALARISASVTHNHPEGIKGAEAVAAAIFLAKLGRSKEEIGEYIRRNYYAMDFTVEELRRTYRFEASCQKTVPQAIVAFLESESFEDAIRNAVSLGGDADTLAAITGSIAWTYYAIQSGVDNWISGNGDSAMQEIRDELKRRIPREFSDIADELHRVSLGRGGTFFRGASCTPIMTEAEREEFTPEYDYSLRLNMDGDY